MAVWWKKSDSQAGQFMNVNRLNGISYKRIVDTFGEPDKIESFDNGTEHVAEWKLRIFNLPFTIRISSDNAAKEKWHDLEGKTKYTIPSLDHTIVDFAEVIGNSAAYEDGIGSLLKMVINNKYSSKAAIKAMKYVFIDMENYV